MFAAKKMSAIGVGVCLSMLMAACGTEGGYTQEELDAAVAQAVEQQATVRTPGESEVANDPTTTIAAPSTTIEATTTTLSEQELADAEYASDMQLIKDLWRGYSDVWFAGVDAGREYMVEHSYRPLHCTAEDFQAVWEVPEGWTDEIIVDASTIERDDDWTLNNGPTAGDEITGRLYIMTIDDVTSYQGSADTQRAEVHTTIMADRAWFFFQCW